MTDAMGFKAKAPYMLCLLLSRKNLCLELWGWLVGKETRNNGLKKQFAKVHSLLLSEVLLKQLFLFFSGVFYIPTAREDNCKKQRVSN